MERVFVVFNYIKNSKNPGSSVEVKIPPPVEVEIQPSSACNLRCWHCIGKNLPHRHDKANVFMSPGQADALLAWQAEGFSVERFRLSGLLGDPLHDEAIDFTLDFLEKAKNKDKHTVLFTNGFGIKESDFKRLLIADNIHVSLDAEKAATFKNMKDASEADFQRITKNLISICAELAKPENSGKKIGIGFVVNEANVTEVDEAIKFAKRTGASFVRFKPDIRPTRAIPWRSLREAEQTIAKAQTEDNDGLDIVMTNVAWQHSRVPTSERCWAQYFFASIAPTGKIHVCDHLTESNGETSIGALLTGTDLNKLWTDAIKSKKFGKRTAHCQLCPPFNWHINRLLDQLFVLYEQYEEDKLRAWISKALEREGLKG
jgi:MoaA/NifB/PqqE/SkfB family radical SAM enzyme